ncbi:TetR/AcrR family transcriptional regulator [Brochothrix campestris]|uniref:Transcriptional regulator n=1 Tax=Brochothrix campestris FSL F6-1037 TaxID=1265861 RepID=W7CR21_9LIST|nr:TetR/AcrR family transcriptional regulator [Brochothrix campestris]EUJ39080.1 transcriptional regulator [Brochothrix campestris FSL F6-1037]
MKSDQGQAKERILAAAMRLFHFRGYHATGLSQILAESKAPKGSLYYHFPGGKEQLAIEAIQQSTSIITAAMIADLAKFDDIIESFNFHIMSIATKFTDFDSNTDFSTIPFGLIASETALVNENIRKTCEVTYQIIEDVYIHRFLQAGYSQAEAEMLSATFNALVEGAVTLSVTLKSNAPLLNIKNVVPLLLHKKEK